MRKKYMKIITAVAALSLAVACTGCTFVTQPLSNATSIVSIEKSKSEGLVDTYTITLSDGTESTFTVTNGSNGADGKDGNKGNEITVNELYELYLQENPTGNLQTFFQEYFSSETEGNLLGIHRALASVAKVHTRFVEPIQGGTGNDSAMYSGSAVVYRVESDYVYFLTNYHVVYSEDDVVNPENLASEIVCYLYGSEGDPAPTALKDTYGYTKYDYGTYGIACEYVAGAATADLALLRAERTRVNQINADVVAAEFAESCSVGQKAYAIGNPKDYGISVTEGVVSKLDEVISLSDVDGTRRSYRSTRIDASTYDGSSGGGLFDTQGKLIGITNAGAIDVENINYAIPLGIVKNVAQSLYDYGTQGSKKMKTVNPGCTISTTSKYVYDAASGYGRVKETITVSSVVAGRAAAQMGLSSGDVLTAITIRGVKYTLNTEGELNDLLYTARVGDTVLVHYERGGTGYDSNGYTVSASDMVSVE